MVESELRTDVGTARVTDDVGTDHAEVVQERGGVGGIVADPQGPGVCVLPTQPRL
jgi:hypothetical protein